MTYEKNSCEVKLPICTQPIVLGNFLAMQYSVFQASENDLTPVLVNYYSNIVSEQDKRVQFSHLHEDKWLVKEKIMHQHHMTWHREIFEEDPSVLINLIRRFISNQYYLTGNYNAFYIKSKPSYQCYDTNTVYLIYGYNDENRVFYAIGKTNSNLFETYNIKYEDYIQSVCNHDKGLFNLNFLKYNDNPNIKTNLKKVYNGIYDYVHSQNKENGVIPEGNAKNYRYGLNCYRSFLKSLATQHEYRRFIEPTSYLVFLEHHILMMQRIDYLKSIGIITHDNIVADYKTLVNLSKCIYDDCQKYNTDFSPHLIRQIYNNVTYIIDNEELILHDVLFSIKHAME